MGIIDGKNDYSLSDLEIEADLSDIKVKCPECNRWKTLRYFMEENCECDAEFEFIVKTKQIKDNQEKGLF